MSHETPHSSGLPFHYWAIILISCGVLFGLAALFLTLGNPKIPMSVQLYGPTSLHSQVPAGFRVSGYSQQTNDPIEIAIQEARLSNGSSSLQNVPCEGTQPLDPDLLCFPPLPWSEGQAEITVTLVGPSAEIQTLTATLPVQNAPPLFVATKGDLVQSESGPIAVEVLSPFGPPVASGDAPLWIRLVHKTDFAPVVGATVNWKLSGRTGSGAQQPDTWREAGTTGATGLVRILMPLAGLGDILSLRIHPDSLTEVTWEQEVPADGMVELLPKPVQEQAATRQVQIRTATLSQELFCTLFWNGVAQSFYRVRTQDYQAQLELPVASSGMRWLACGSRPVTSEKWAVATPLWSGNDATETNEHILQAVVAAEPRFQPSTFQGLPAAEAATLRAYLAARLQPPELPMVQLANTYQSVLDRATADVKDERFRLLVAMGLVGLGLISWAFTVVYRQSRINQQNLLEATRQEGDEPLAQPSHGRLLISLLGIIVPMILNIAGLIFLMTLLFR